jgi:flagellar biosynthesis protein
LPESSEKRAVALRYQGEKEEAPRVIAKGRGLIADKIEELARDAGVPVREDASLVEVLAKIDIDQLIPPELYQALAEVLAWAYRQDKDFRTS